MSKCQYCEQYVDEIGKCPDPNTPLLQEKFTEPMTGEWVELSAEYWPSEGLCLYASTQYKDRQLDCIKINYCPMCGRKLGDE